MREQIYLHPTDEEWQIIFPSPAVGTSPGSWDVVLDLPVKMALEDAVAWLEEQIEEHGSVRALAEHVAEQNEVNQSNLGDYPSEMSA